MYIVRGVDTTSNGWSNVEIYRGVETTSNGCQFWAAADRARLKFKKIAQNMEITKNLRIKLNDMVSELSR